jgi:hypothetical protein
MSDKHWKHACNPWNATEGARSFAFGTGYHALLGICSADERQAVVDHPSMAFLRRVSARVSLDSSVAIAYVELQTFAPHQLMQISLDEMLAWARAARVVAGMERNRSEADDDLANAMRVRAQAEVALAQWAVQGLRDLGPRRVLDESNPDDARLLLKFRALSESAARRYLRGPSAGVDFEKVLLGIEVRMEEDDAHPRQIEPAEKPMADLSVLYLDYDGVLHPDDVYTHPRRGLYLRDSPGHELLEHAGLLAELLAP